MTEHDTRTLAPKARAIDSPTALAKFARAHPYCQCCGADFRPLHVHHIIGGRGGRSDEPVNLLRLCHHPCHTLAERLDVRDEFWPPMLTYGMDERPALLPKLTLGIQLSLKLRAGELDDAGLARLAVLHGRSLPEPEPIPEVYVRWFRMNRPELV